MIGPTHPYVVAEEPKGYFSCKSSQSVGSQDHARIPNLEYQGCKRSLQSIWWWKSVGTEFAWERRESTKDPDTIFPGLSTPYCYRTSLVNAHLPTTSDSTLLSSSPAERSAGCNFGGSFSGEALGGDWDSVIELFSFGTGVILPNLVYTTPPPVKSLCLCFYSLWPHSAELSPTGELECCTDLGPWSMSPWKALVWCSDGCWVVQLRLVETRHFLYSL